MKLGKRVIGFFDILGFSNKINESKDFSLFFDQFVSLIGSLKTKVFQIPSGINPVLSPKMEGNFEISLIAFDSILLISHPLDTPQSSSRFIMSCVELMQLSWSLGFPLRGGIEVEEVYFDKENEIYLSKAQPKLSKLEKEQDWVGCGISNNAFSFLKKELFFPEFLAVHSPILKFSPPMKCRKLDREIKGIIDYSLNWIITLPPKDFDNFLLELDEPKKWETRNFAEFVYSMRESTYVLTPPDSSIHKLRYLTTHYQLSFLCLDKNMDKISPPASRLISFHNGSYITPPF